MLAALVLIPFYVGSLVWQRQFHGRVHRLLLQRSPALHVGSTQLLDPSQLRPVLLLALNLLYGTLLLISDLLMPLGLGFFPPTQILAAARSVDGISTDPEPFVLQSSLNDFHISYAFNASVVDVNQYCEILSAPLEITPCAMATAAQCAHPHPHPHPRHRPGLSLPECLVIAAYSS
jgi:hypothetical protein